MEEIKISAYAKVTLGLTAAFLLLLTGYFLGRRSQAVPYRVDVQIPAEETLPPPLPALSPPPPVGQTLVDINTASAGELEALPGIGEKRAADIVADRVANGPFRHVEDITRVRGIGEGTLEGIIDLITAG